MSDKAIQIVEKMASIMDAFGVESDPTCADLVDLLGLVTMRDLEHDDLAKFEFASCTAKIGRIDGLIEVFSDKSLVEVTARGCSRIFEMKEVAP